MNRLHRTLIWTLLALVGLGSSGCSRIRLPAIDPSGARIFLPPPNYTTLATPEHLRLGQGHCPLLPKPAFEGPPTPPPCGTGVAPPPPPGAVPPPRHGLHQRTAGQPRKHHDKHNPGRAGTLQVTPSRVVAPVGGEVVLRAGVCGEDGFLIKKQPLEWILSQDSVGHFVEIGDEAAHHLASLGREEAKKQSPVFATGRTSSKPQLVTRGTPNPIDDVQLKRGEGWISLTSATEGSSHVTVLAPKTEGWEQRRQTATVHWIDAQWVLPPPAVERAAAGRTHRLVTTVSRTTGGSPAAGWKVKYEIAGGPPAVLLSSGGQGTSVTVTTDSAGQAIADLQATSAEPGSSQVQIQIIRAGDASGDLAELPIGEGWTTITWSAPGLKLDVRGPEMVEQGTTLTYQIDVSNHGDQPVRNVVLRAQLPPGIEFVSSSVPVDREVVPARFFNLGDLGPSTRRSVAITCRATRNLGVDVIARFDAAADDDLSATQEVRTEVLTPVLALTLQGPETAEVGEEVQFRLEITNQSRSVVQGATLRLDADPGLRHTENLKSPIERPIENLAPGKTLRVAASFIVEKPGVLCCRAHLEVIRGQRISPSQACVTASQPAQPAATPIQIDMQSREDIEFGYDILIKNAGNREVNDLVLSVRYPASLEVVGATEGGQRGAAENTFSWTLARRLLPGQTEVRSLQFRPLARGGDAEVEVSVGSGQQVLASDVFAIALPGGPGAQPGPNEPRAEQDLDDRQPPPRDTAPPTRTGATDDTLSVTISRAAQGNVGVGDDVRFLIRVTNRADVIDGDVTLRVDLPTGLNFQGFNRPQREIQISPDGRSLRVEPVRTLRAGESLDYTLTVRPTVPGRFTVRAEASSDHQRQPTGQNVELRVP